MVATQLLCLVFVEALFFIAHFRYILGVESPLICDILPQANEYGLMDMVSSEEHSTLNEDGSGSGQEDSEEVLQLRKALG